MNFSGKLYSYQSEILDIFEKERSEGEKKIHIVAPPGSGKTIVGLEMITRIDKPSLILVPNLTLQEQWKDKLEKLFLESGESLAALISTDIREIKKINIITYQSLSMSDAPDDSVHEEILAIWYESEKKEFPSREAFNIFLEGLKEENPSEYKDLYTSSQKKLKDSGSSVFTRKLMKKSIHDYIAGLRSYGVGVMLVDEAHHLTSWWSHVLYEIWGDLDEPYIIGLTATPPFESADYFELDESYTRLLGEVDYYIPTPAIVKSGRLAPYSDLLYIVEPDKNLANILDLKEKILKDFIEIHKSDIINSLHAFLVENFARLSIKSLDLMEKWMRFIYVYRDPTIDMSSYITGNARELLTLEDIAKSIGKWGSDGFKKSKKTTTLDEIKSLFFDLGYIWRGANLYRFQTPLEKGLIYSKSKIEATRKIITKEKENLSDTLRIAIITDFLDADSDWINAHYIFDELVKDFPELNPYLVSGQGIWGIRDGIKSIISDETILTITDKLTQGETGIVIGTRGILGEGWDCPAVNTLIDLTGVSAYMSVNQVHGRAIRLDLANPDKVANIYDIVCLGTGYQGMRDFDRLKKKHTQFYGVNDSGLIIKELDHIYPQLEKLLHNPEKINAYTLKKSSLRSMIKDLWGIGGEYKNTEVFSLSIEIIKPYEIIPIPSDISSRELLFIRPELWQSENILELGKSSYHRLVRRWICEMIDASIQVMKPFGIVPRDFSYDIKWSDSGSITIFSRYHDPLVAKKFIEIISTLFGDITDEKYKYEVTETALEKMGTSLIPVPFLGLFMSIPISVPPILVFNSLLPMLGVLMGSSMMACILAILMYRKKINSTRDKMTKNTISLGLPNIISSNEEKRRLFLGKVKESGLRGFLRRVIHLDGDILPVDQKDIGKQLFLSSKIEKLWI